MPRLMRLMLRVGADEADEADVAGGGEADDADEADVEGGGAHLSLRLMRLM